MPETQTVAMRTKLAFGVGAGAEAGIHIAFNTFNFLYYNNVLGLSGTLAGMAVTIALVFDAVSDPIVGSISDRWRSNLGRRHPFLYAAAIPLALFFFCIYAPPKSLEGLSLFLWLTTFTILLRTALTFYHVPHLALGAELTTDYRERSVVMSYNSIFGVVGGASAFFFAWTYFSSLDGGTMHRAGYPVMAAGIGVIAALVILASAFFTRDQIPRLAQPPSDLPSFSLPTLLGEIRDCLRNRNYLVLLLGLFCLSATLGVRETISSYMSLFFWELEPSQIRFLALASPPGFVIAFIATARLHTRFDKRETIIGSVIGLVLVAAGPITLRMLGLFPENHSPALFPALCVAIFGSYGCGAVLSISVMSALADIADEHELTSGRRQEGVFYAARTFFGKLTSSLGHLLAGIAIDVIGFSPGASPGEVDPTVIFRLGLLDGPIAAIPALISIIFYATYRID
ncbi:MAG: MFS transporter, partial [Deltaproteobacteria bacterium]|nr:MFS transporter [Deltaproteobacteria bacterium]